MAIPCQIGGRFARSRRRIGIGGKAALGLGGAEHTPRLGLTDGDVAGRKVEQDLRPGQSGLGAGRRWGPDILADLDMEAKGRAACGLEQQVGTERNLFARDRDDLRGNVRPGGEPALFVKLAVIRQE